MRHVLTLPHVGKMGQNLSEIQTADSVLLLKSLTLSHVGKMGQNLSETQTADSVCWLLRSHRPRL